MLSRENVWTHLMSGSRIYEEHLPESEENRIAVKADDKI